MALSTEHLLIFIWRKLICQWWHHHILNYFIKRMRLYTTSKKIKAPKGIFISIFRWNNCLLHEKQMPVMPSLHPTDLPSSEQTRMLSWLRALTCYQWPLHHGHIIQGSKRSHKQPSTSKWWEWHINNSSLIRGTGCSEVSVFHTLYGLIRHPLSHAIPPGATASLSFFCCVRKPTNHT